MDYIAMAETLEAQAASLRREAARVASEGQTELELAAAPVWMEWSGGEAPPDAAGKFVDVRTRDEDEFFNMPSAVVTWRHHNDPSDVVQWCLSVEQPATP